MTVPPSWRGLVARARPIVGQGIEALRSLGLRPPAPMPWGLVAALFVWFGLVTTYVALTYWASPDYQAAKHLDVAVALLGKDNGRGVPEPQLERAYEELLEAGRLLPGQGAIHSELEHLNWRFEERGWTVPIELRHRAEALAIDYRRIAEQEAPLLAVGHHEQGWEPQTLLEGPKNAFGVGLTGVVPILLFWGYRRWTERRVHGEDKEAWLRGVEEEAAELGEFRRGLPGAPQPQDPARRKTAAKKPSVP